VSIGSPKSSYVYLIIFWILTWATIFRHCNTSGRSAIKPLVEITPSGTCKVVGRLFKNSFGGAEIKSLTVLKVSVACCPAPLQYGHIDPLGNGIGPPFRQWFEDLFPISSNTQFTQDSKTGG